MNAAPAAPIFVLRDLSPGDCEAALALSRSVGWPHRLEDWRFALELGQGLAAAAGDRVIGTALWWDFGAQARLGMVIVDPGLQRAGVGRVMMEAALARISAPNVLLTATAAGAPLYRRLGFSPQSGVMQHQGVAPADGPSEAPAVGRVRALAGAEGRVVAALDASAHGATRSRLIDALLDQAEGVALETGRGLEGFAFCRRFGRGHVIGPVVAAEAATARALIAHWLAARAGAFVRIDVPDGAGLGDWLAARGLAPTGAAATMARRAPRAPEGRFSTFALASQALG